MYRCAFICMSDVYILSIYNVCTERQALTIFYSTFNHQVLFVCMNKIHRYAPFMDICRDTYVCINMYMYTSIKYDIYVITADICSFICSYNSLLLFYSLLMRCHLEEDIGVLMSDVRGKLDICEEPLYLGLSKPLVWTDEAHITP